ncbi:MAG: hypothetical protein KatS3mg059_1659 [Thermomicrobiales bacterium]|nr:MAG: hypothetical protein KatS3mg059_1659 [Thermomicrobiales bacterium]
MTRTLLLLPQPEQVMLHDGVFTLDAAAQIEIPAPVSESMLRSARLLQEAVEQQTGLCPPIVPAGTGQPGDVLVLGLAKRPGAWERSDPDQHGQARNLGPQGYTLRITSEGVSVAATSQAGVFYGVQTLIQIIKQCGRQWPGLIIADRPALPVRGFMLDVSRGKVPTLRTLTRLLQTLSHFKYNQLQLYIEHTFRFPRHPEISAGADPLTSEDILELDALCRAHHIELVPNLQSLGHHRRLLSLPQYAHLAETPWRWSFATANEETFALFDEIYGDFLAPFTSRWLNIGADEPWDLGRGQSAALTAETGIGRVYLRHVQRLHALAAKHGRRIMLWADMLKHHPELAGELPEDVLLLDWWYEARPRYETLDVLSAAGRPFFVCPGTSSWTTLFPRLENAIANIRDYVRQGIEAGAQGMLLTDWGDDGHYQPYSHSWYPILWGAEVAWTGGRTGSATFDAALSTLFLGDSTGRVVAALRQLGAMMQAAPVWLTSWNTAMALFEEPLAGRMWRVADRDTVQATRDAAGALVPLLHAVNDWQIRHDLGFTAMLVQFACDKVETTRAIRTTLSELATHQNPQPEALAKLDACLDVMRQQRATLPALIEEFQQRWLAEARPSEIRINLDRFTALLAQYDHALAWLARQREAYASGQPVDATLSSYDRRGYAVLYEASYRWIQELAALIGAEALPPDIQEWLAEVEQIMALA